MTFKRNLEIAIGAFKYDTDTWKDVFDRVNREGGIDNKKIVNVLICILEELDAKQEIKQEIKQEVTFKKPRINTRTKNKPIQSRVSSITTKIPTTTDNTKKR